MKEKTTLLILALLVFTTSIAAVSADENIHTTPSPNDETKYLTFELEWDDATINLRPSASNEPTTNFDAGNEIESPSLGVLGKQAATPSSAAGGVEGRASAHGGEIKAPEISAPSFESKPTSDEPTTNFDAGNEIESPSLGVMGKQVAAPSVDESKVQGSMSVASGSVDGRVSAQGGEIKASKIAAEKVTSYEMDNADRTALMMKEELKTAAFEKQCMAGLNPSETFLGKVKSQLEELTLKINQKMMYQHEIGPKSIELFRSLIRTG